DYSIIDCLNSKTEITFESTTHKVEIKKGIISFVDKIDLSKMNRAFEMKNFDKCKKEFENLSRISDNFLIEYKFSVMWDRLSSEEQKTNDISKYFNEFSKEFNFDMDLSETEILEIIQRANSIKRQHFFKSPLYIPAERVIVNLLKQAALSLQNL
ncbi:MAG TPA: hypothetical protein PLH20_13515, partial [Flavobacterium sp.]|nr:hypothetical protein [Flavobacterium sp.]